jgi:hypothetical protein
MLGLRCASTVLGALVVVESLVEERLGFIETTGGFE